MRRAVALLALALLTLAAAPLRGAGDDGSTFATSDTLYVHFTRTPAFASWMNTLADDPANEGSDDGLNVIAFVGGSGTATFDFPIQPALAAPADLVAGGTATFDIWVGGSAPDQVGQVTVTATLQDGTAALATTPASDTVSYQGDMHEVTLTAPVMATHLAAGDALNLHLDIAGAGTFIHVGNGGATQSKVTLPVLPASHPLAQTFQNLTGPSVNIASNVTNATTHVDHYNWTAPAGALNVSFAAHVANGTVQALVVDANGTVRYNHTLAGNGTNATVISGPVGGNWTITLRYGNFTGNATFAIAPHAAPSTPAPTPTHNATTSAATSSTPSGKTSPGVGLAAGLAILGVAAWVARRRR